MGRWCKVGLVGFHGVNGAFIVVSDDVACSIAESEFGVLLVALSQLRYSLLNRRCDGIFYGLVSPNDLPCHKVEAFVAAS